jgi:hypothetical protein
MSSASQILNRTHPNSRYCETRDTFPEDGFAVSLEPCAWFAKAL